MIDSLGFIKYNHFLNPNDYVYLVPHYDFKVDIMYTNPVQACVHHIWNTYHNAKHVYTGYEFSQSGLLSCQFKNVIDDYESSIGWFPTLDREKDKEYTLPLDVVAEQIVKNAKAGHAESVDFVQAVADELNKQMGAKPIASANANEDTDTSNPDKEKDDKPEPPKTCRQIDPNMPKCMFLNGFKYSSREQVISEKGIRGLRKEKTENYNTFCGTYGTHEKYFPNKNIRTHRGNYGASLSSCKCCQESFKGGIVFIKWRYD